MTLWLLATAFLLVTAIPVYAHSPCYESCPCSCWYATPFEPEILEWPDDSLIESEPGGPFYLRFDHTLTIPEVEADAKSPPR